MNTGLKIKILYSLCVIGLVFWGMNVFAGFSEIMNSTNYKINPGSVNVGGTDSQSSTNYKMKDTIGEIASGIIETISYTLKAGYRYMVDIVPTPTPAPTATPTAGGPGPIEDKTPPIISDISVSNTSVSSVMVLWKTDEQALCKFYLGMTSGYELTTFEEFAFYLDHSLQINKLLPEITYHFKISCRDTNYNQGETGDLIFIVPGEKPLPNVSDLSSEAEENKITLTWKNPDIPEFEGVKILRSDKFYPAGPSDGELVYQGKDTSFEDTNVETLKRYYYTVFTYDKEGNHSSGAVISDVPRPPGVIVPPPPEEIPPIVPPPPEIEKITIQDFDFFLETQKIPVEKGEKLQANAEKPLTVFLNAANVPEVLKTIMVTLKKDNKFFSFILKANKDKTGYEATILSPSEPGIYPLAITILDYKNQTLKRITGFLEVRGLEIPPIKYSWQDRLSQYIYYIYLLPGAGLLLLIILLFWKRKKKKEEKIDDFKFSISDFNLAGSPPQKITDIEGKERKDFPNFKI